MKRLFIIALLFIGIMACSEDDEPSIELAEGTYTGVFYRTSPNARWATSDVRLVLDDNQFSGSSSIPRYPAICEGTYELISANAIQFTNTCAFTADFDWTFILDGDFSIRREGEKIIISRQYEGSVVDTYELTSP